jgi:hypothetical protein
MENMRFDSRAEMDYNALAFRGRPFMPPRRLRTQIALVLAFVCVFLLAIVGSIFAGYRYSYPMTNVIDMNATDSLTADSLDTARVYTFTGLDSTTGSYAGARPSEIIVMAYIRDSLDTATAPANPATVLIQGLAAGQYWTIALLDSADNNLYGSFTTPFENYYYSRIRFTVAGNEGRIKVYLGMRC